MKIIVIRHGMKDNTSDRVEKVEKAVEDLEQNGYEVIDIDFNYPHSVIKYKSSNDIVLKTRNDGYTEIHSIAKSNIENKEILELKKQLAVAEQNAEEYKNNYDIMVGIAKDYKDDAVYYKDCSLELQRQYEAEQREKSKYINENKKLQEKLNKNKKKWWFL